MRMRPVCERGFFRVAFWLPFSLSPKCKSKGCNCLLRLVRHKWRKDAGLSVVRLLVTVTLAKERKKAGIKKPNLFGCCLFRFVDPPCKQGFFFQKSKQISITREPKTALNCFPQNWRSPEMRKSQAPLLHGLLLKIQCKFVTLKITQMKKIQNECYIPTFIRGLLSEHSLIMCSSQRKNGEIWQSVKYIYFCSLSQNYVFFSDRYKICSKCEKKINRMSSILYKRTQDSNLRQPKGQIRMQNIQLVCCVFL